MEALLIFLYSQNRKAKLVAIPKTARIVREMVKEVIRKRKRNRREESNGGAG